MDDKQIIALFFRRSEEAIGALAARYGALLQHVAVNILGNALDAQECVNDSYLALWDRIPPQEPSPLRAYACRVTRNIALTRRRDDHADRRNSQYDLSLEELSACIAGPGLDEQLDARQLGRAIDAFLDTISRENRIIFLRRHWFGDSVGDIAARMGLKENTVSVRLSRTRSLLRAYLVQEGYIHEGA